jgi:hypothetical protein
VANKLRARNRSEEAAVTWAGIRDSIKIINNTHSTNSNGLTVLYMIIKYVI